MQDSSVFFYKMRLSNSILSHEMSAAKALLLVTAKNLNLSILYGNDNIPNSFKFRKLLR